MQTQTSRLGRMGRLSPTGLLGRSGRTLGALLALVAILTLAVLPATAGAQAQDADRSGRYEGVQHNVGDEGVSVPFILTLQQDGNTLSGLIAQGRRGSDLIDRVSGALSGGTAFLVRHSQPTEFWIGSFAEGQAAGRWFSAGGAGTWSATKLERETVLRIELGVEPNTIPAGATTERVTYTLIVRNAGEVTAENVQVSLGRFPDFFQILDVITDRGTPEIDRSEADTTLHLRELGGGETVALRVIGSASPRQAGEFTTFASAAASNAERVAARTTLHVEGSSLEIRSAFIPSRVPQGTERQVVYTVLVTGRALQSGTVVVQDSEAVRLLTDGTLVVRGAEVRGSLAEGLQIVSLTTDEAAVQINWRGSVQHLEAGRYATTTTAGTTAADGVRVTSSAGLLVVERDAERDRERDTDRERDGERQRDGRMDEGQRDDRTDLGDRTDRDERTERDERADRTDTTDRRDAGEPNNRSDRSNRSELGNADSSIDSLRSVRLDLSSANSGLGESASHAFGDLVDRAIAALEAGDRDSAASILRVLAGELQQLAARDQGQARLLFDRVHTILASLTGS